MKVMITHEKHIVDGGCNACGFVNCDTTQVEFEDGFKTSLESFELDALIMAMAIKARWRQAFVPVGIGEEELVLKKDGQEVVVDDDSYTKVSYKKAGETFTFDKVYEDCQDMFQEANHALTEIFGTEPIEFELAK